MNTDMIALRAEVDKLQKRCGVGVGGRYALYDAHSIMADCYGTLGKLMLELEAAIAANKDCVLHFETLMADYKKLEAKQRPMTDEELQTAADKSGLHAAMLGQVPLVPRGLLVEFARAIQAHHGIK